MPTSDPYRYFRIEAAEIVDALGQGLLALEREPSPATLRDLLRRTHTLKGAARVVGATAIAELAHRLEGEIGRPPAQREPIEALLERVDVLRERLAELDRGRDQGPGAKPPGKAAVAGPQPPSITGGGDLEGVSAALGELRRRVTALEQVAIDLEEIERAVRSGARPFASGTAGRPDEIPDRLEAAVRRLRGELEAVDRELERSADHAARLRLRPASAVFAKVERTVRDAAAAQQVRVDLEVSGGEVRLDGRVLAAVGEALPHVARNAVAHGWAPGSSRPGRIRLVVERRGRRVRFRLVDDGRGIDLPGVLRSAVAAGVVAAEAADRLGDAEVAALVFEPGVSTAKDLDQLAGRGIGLDAVRSLLEGVQGTVSVATEPGRSTTFTLDVPVSVAAYPALQVSAGDDVWSLPLDRVRAVVALDRAAAGATGRVAWEGETIPLAEVAALVGRPGGRPARAVVVESEGRRLALGVDRVLGSYEASVQAVPSRAGDLPLVEGFTVDRRGHPRAVLDVAGLLSRAAEPGTVAAVTPPERAIPRILVVDDSLTSRMLQQSILESAGYRVDLASSGEEGLQAARRGDHSLLLVDVEMPGLDGLELVRAVRRDPQLREVPCVLVTSLSGEENRRRGEQAGADAYVVKGEFDQEAFLTLVAELVGL